MKNCSLHSAGRKLAALAVIGRMSVGLVSAGVITYTRDGGGRLTGVQYANGKAHGYTYDAAGNLARRAATLPGIGGDSDGDGLPDDWELLFFGNLGRDGTGDFDSDGFKDSSEFLAGTNPVDPQSLLSITRATAGAGEFTIEWQAVAGKTYRVQYKDTLNAPVWSDVGGDVTASGGTAAKTDPTAGVPQRFYRVTLSP
jgi:YD repeat-containing protein